MIRPLRVRVCVVAVLLWANVGCAQEASVPQDRVSPLMQSLYGATIVIQGMDAYSTFRALDAGAHEVNPLVSGIAERRPAFIALKAGIAAGIIYLA